LYNLLNLLILLIIYLLFGVVTHKRATYFNKNSNYAQALKI